MKIKRIILVLFVMFMPFVVNAQTCDTSKITISSVELDNKSNSVVELSEPTASGKNVNLDLSMTNEGDNIQYKIVVRNDSDEDYELDSNSLGLSSDYVTYTLDAGSDSIVKANSTKTVFLRVKYTHKVPANAFKSGLYTDSKDLVVNLSNDKVISVNPNTGISYLLYVMIIAAFGISGYIAFKKKKHGVIAIIIVGIITVPASVYALCKCEIKVTSNVEIQQTNFTGVIYRNNEYKIRPGDSIIPSWKWIVYNVDNDIEYLDQLFSTKEECEDMISNHSSPKAKVGNRNVICKQTKIGAGEYVTKASDLNKNYYIRDEVQNDIVTKVQVCFVTTKEVCLNPGETEFMNNYTTIQGEESWFNEHEGNCSFNDAYAGCNNDQLRVYADLDGAEASLPFGAFCNPYYCGYNEFD